MERKRRKIYFAGSIRGGREDAQLYAAIISHLQKTEDVLTEHIGKTDLDTREQGRSGDARIYEQDTAWLRECDLVIAECSNPSLGVGYEMAYAERYNKPVFIFYDRERTQLSAMLTGDEYFHIIPYEKPEEIFRQLDRILQEQ